jgi:hypothetical protein
MASDDKKTKTSPAPKNETAVKKEPAAKKRDEGQPKNKITSDADLSKAEGRETADKVFGTHTTSQALTSEDWQTFYDQAKAGLQGRAYLILIDASGRQQLNTYVPYGEQPAMTGDPTACAISSVTSRDQPSAILKATTRTGLEYSPLIILLKIVHSSASASSVWRKARPSFSPKSLSTMWMVTLSVSLGASGGVWLRMKQHSTQGATQCAQAYTD